MQLNILPLDYRHSFLVLFATGDVRVGASGCGSGGRTASLRWSTVYNHDVKTPQKTLGAGDHGFLAVSTGWVGAAVPLLLQSC